MNMFRKKQTRTLVVGGRTPRNNKIYNLGGNRYETNNHTPAYKLNGWPGAFTTNKAKANEHAANLKKRKNNLANYYKRMQARPLSARA